MNAQERYLEVCELVVMCKRARNWQFGLLAVSAAHAALWWLADERHAAARRFGIRTSSLLFIGVLLLLTSSSFLKLLWMSRLAKRYALGDVP